jgi:hypothetical protein
MAMVTSIRVLPQEEWPRLLQAEGSPFQKTQRLPDERFATVIAEEDYDEIVGTWMATQIILLEGLWRKRPKGYSAKRLLIGMMRHLQNRRAKTAITYIEDPEVAALADAAGFVKLPGAVYLLTREE